MTALRTTQTAAVAFAAAAAMVACGGNSNTPTSPTAVTPTGSTCSGSPIPNVTISLGQSGGTVQQFTAQVYGEALTGSAPPSLLITRNVVPCDYELVVRVESPSGPLNLQFGFPPRTTAPSSGGVEPGSVVLLEGPASFNSSFGGAKPNCGWSFGDGGTPAPFTVRMRFRVVAGISESARC